MIFNPSFIITIKKKPSTHFVAQESMKRKCEVCAPLELGCGHSFSIQECSSYRNDQFGHKLPICIQQYIQDETFSIQEVSIGSLRISSGVTHMFDNL